MSKKIITSTIVFIAILTAIGLFLTHKTASAPTKAVEILKPATLDDLIIVTFPIPNQSVASPLTISGKARGNWYSEAVFPITLLDSKGNAIATGQAQAQDNWMTNEYVPFTAQLTFTATTATGTLVLHNDNPSGDPSNDKELRIPVTFTK